MCATTTPCAHARCTVRRVRQACDACASLHAAVTHWPRRSHATCCIALKRVVGLRGAFEITECYGLPPPFHRVLSILHCCGPNLHDRRPYHSMPYTVGPRPVACHASPHAYLRWHACTDLLVASRAPFGWSAGCLAGCDTLQGRAPLTELKPLSCSRHRSFARGQGSASLRVRILPTVCPCRGRAGSALCAPDRTRRQPFCTSQFVPSACLMGPPTGMRVLLPETPDRKSVV